MSVLALLDEETDEDAFAALPDAKPLGPRLDVLGAAGRGVVKGALDIADSAASFARDLADWRARPMPAWQRRIYEQEALSQDAEVAERARAYVEDYDRNVETIKAGRLQRALEREAVFNPAPGNVVNDVAYGVGQFAPAIAATAVNPALGVGVLGASADAQGRLSEAQQLDQGVDADTAAQVGATTRAAVFIGGLLPGGVAVRAGAKLGVQGASITARNLGTRLALRASSGAALNVGAGVAERVAIGSILEKAGYAEQAKAYRWDDATSLTVDALLGAAFGSVEGAPAARVLEAPQRRKLLEDADALHARHQTAPGIPLNAAAEDRHDRALALAAEQIERGDDIDLSSIFSDEDDLFAPALLDEPEARGGEDALFTPEAGQAAPVGRSEEETPRFLSPEARLEAEVSAMVEEVQFLRTALPKRLKARGKSLASFVVARGGVRDDGGDVLAVLGDYKARPGLINNRRGLNVDDMARMAWEEGYFPELSSHARPSVNQFLEALDGDLRKTSPRYLGREAGEAEELRLLLRQYEQLYVDVEADEPQLRAQLREVAQRQRLEERAATAEVARELDNEAPDALGAAARKWTQADEDEFARIIGEDLLSWQPPDPPPEQYFASRSSRLDNVGFFSAVEESIGNLPAERWGMGWTAVRSSIAKGRGVDGYAGRVKDEIDYLGLDDAFKDSKLRGEELRRAVGEYVELHKLVLEERWSRYDPANPPLRGRIRDKGSVYVLEMDGGLARKFATRAEAEAAQVEYARSLEQTSASAQKAGIRRGPGDLRLPGDDPVFELRLKLPPGTPGSDFKSHWSRAPSNDDGVLVSVRGEERIDDAGKRTLFGGEVQSDLAQANRQAKERGEAGVPAPLTNRTSQWTNAAVRAMVFRAARDGFDSVSFPTGETSTLIQGNDDAAAHYDTNVRGALEKVAGLLGGEVREGGVGYQVQARDWAQVDSDTAERLLKGVFDRLPPTMRARLRRNLSTMRRAENDEFYVSNGRDPRDANASGFPLDTWNYTLRNEAGGNPIVAAYQIWVQGAVIWEEPGAFEKMLEVAAEGDAATGDAVRQAFQQASRDLATAYVLDITPQMREQVLREGFPLFGSQRGVGGASVGVATQALKDSAVRAFGVGPEVVDRLLRSGKLTIVETDADARRLLDASKTNLPDGQGGIFRAATGEAVIVAANVDPATAHRVMLHEVGVHAGMRGLLGEKRFARLLGSVDAMLPQALREGAEYRELVDAMRLLGRDREALGSLLERFPNVNENVLLSFAEAEAFSLRPEQRAEEALAYLVENAPELPLVQRVLASIRQWLWRTFGTTFGPSLTQADLQMMAVAALRRESSLAPTATGIRGVLGEKRYAQLLKAIGARVPAEVLDSADFKALASAVRVYGRDSEEAAAVARNGALQELDRELVLTFAEADIQSSTPEQRLDEVVGLLANNVDASPTRRAFATVQQRLFQLFGPAFRLGDAELASLWYTALRRDRSLNRAQGEGYAGIEPEEGREWLRAKQKGLDMGAEARMARAREMGFDTATVLYHGTEYTADKAPIDAFRPPSQGKKTAGAGVFLTPDPRRADSYAALGAVYPVYVRAQNLLEVDAKGANWKRVRDPETGEITTTDALAVRAREQSYDGVRIRNVVDYGSDLFEEEHIADALQKRGVHLERDSDGRWVFQDVDAQLLQEARAEVDPGRPGETVVVFDPSAIRSIHAAFDPDYSDSANLLASFGRLQTPEGRAELVREMTVAQGDDGSTAYGWTVGDTPIAMAVRPKTGGVFGVSFGALRGGGISFARIGASLDQSERILEGVLAALRYDMESQRRPRYQFYGADGQLQSLYDRLLRRFGTPEGYRAVPSKSGVITLERTDVEPNTSEVEPGAKIDAAGKDPVEALATKIAPDTLLTVPSLRPIERARGAAYDDLRAAWSGDASPVIRATAEVVRDDPEFALLLDGQAVRGSDALDAVGAQELAAQQLAPVFPEAVQCAIASGGVEAAPAVREAGGDILQAQASRIVALFGAGAGVRQMLAMDEAA